MFPIPDSSYARWRLQSGACALLHEDHQPPPEHLLQAVWQHQRLRRDGLKTSDGRSLRVLHPGFLNCEGGPDFKNAVIQFGSETPVSGDVEVDILAAGWRAHGHHRNRAFTNVILHVIWDEEDPLADAPPSISLASRLDAPLAELSYWLSSDPPHALPENIRGRCADPLRHLSAERIAAILREAGQIRFQAKAAQFQARARQAGWEQALWEGLFRALGYKHNSWAMLCLAEHRERWFSARASSLELQARLFGISGLLPSELTGDRRSTDKYLRTVWDQWWRERDEFADCALSPALWRCHGQRPANHPNRRLALAAHWLATGGMVDKLEHWCSSELGEVMGARRSLMELLQVEHDLFWSWHWTLRSHRLPRKQPLLGASRATDLAINVILPWLWIRALEGKNESVQTSIEKCYEQWPMGQDNTVLRLARQRLFWREAPVQLRTAAEQQGLLQIVRDFCDHSNAICLDCRFPDLIPKCAAESQT